MINDTDAEGRLIIVDAIEYFKIKIYRFFYFRYYLNYFKFYLYRVLFDK